MPRVKEPPEPWRSFFAEVDSHLNEDVQLHCCGGFVVTQLYGVARSTSDVDFLGVVPNVMSALTGSSLIGRFEPESPRVHRFHKGGAYPANGGPVRVRFRLVQGRRRSQLRSCVAGIDPLLRYR
jgi:hypothetical protein